MKYYWKEFIYRMIKSFLSFSFAFTYRNIISSGYKEVRKNKPAIFVANHQNTFMDGVLMVYTAGFSNPSILVRADIFKSKFAKIALGLLKLLPIYRKRDGLNNLSQNEQIFNQCFEIFSHKGVVGLFPEGNHAFPRKLRTLQKGAARIAFQAEEKNDFKLNLSLIPVGLQYENHTERWHDVYVHYTQPIYVKDFKDAYHESPQKVYKTVTDKIEAGISSQMIDIQWEDEIELFENIRLIMKSENKEKATETTSLVHHEQHMILKLINHLKNHESEKSLLETKVNKYISKLKNLSLNVNYSLESENPFILFIKTMLLVLSSPFYLGYKLIAAIPEFIIEKKVIAGVKDITWHLSLRFAIGAILYPIYFTVIWIILALSLDNTLAAIIIFSLPIINVAGLEWMYQFRTVKNQLILTKHKGIVLEKNSLVNELNSISN